MGPKLSWPIAFAVVGACVFGQPAWATIVSGNVTGGTYSDSTFVILDLPFDPPNGPVNTVGKNDFNTHDLYGFNEDQNILLTSDLLVNVGATISAGTMVASHYIFWDPPGDSSSTLKKVTGNVVFDSAILGIATSKALLSASDFLANTGVTYLDPNLRGLESTDHVSINGSNTLQIDLHFEANTPGDYIRVFTAYSPTAAGPPPAVPLPAALPLFASGLAAFGGLGAWRKRRARRA